MMSFLKKISGNKTFDFSFQNYEIFCSSKKVGKKYEQFACYYNSTYIIRIEKGKWRFLKMKESPNFVMITLF